MILIINTLLHYKIKPIVVEVPNFGVEDVQKYKNVFSRYTNAISEAIDGDEVMIIMCLHIERHLIKN